jgi:hypothetical protein
VILVYREWLSRLFSQYSELCKRAALIAESFSFYLFENYGDVSSTPSRFNYQYLIQLFGSNLGKNGVFLIDYSGIEAEKKDLSFGIFCDILKLSSFCEPSLYTNSTRDNASPDSVVIHLLGLVRNYIFMKNYQFSHEIMKNTAKYVAFSKNLVFRYAEDRDLRLLSSAMLKIVIYACYCRFEDRM